MCVLYVSFAMGSECIVVYFEVQICSYILQVDLSGFNVRLFCFVQAKTLCRYGCMYFLTALVLVCVDVMVMSSA